ncbi:general odorant-binding protein 19d-like [Lycorma delicatula]|uniref:general odorant-binding protein 19d-like n=1 Tax=Lycorma delicatula TaxID=130591 RepID=UPI003F510B3F
MFRRMDVLFYITIFQLCFLFLHVNGQHDELTLFNNCKAEAQATDEDIASFRNQQIPTTKSGKCMLACMFNGSGLLIDGKYNVDGALKLTSQVYAGNGEKLQKANEVVNRCAKEAEGEGDKCEIAAKVAKCTMNISAEVGLV